MLDTDKLAPARFIAKLFVVKLCYLGLSVHNRSEPVTGNFGAPANVIEAHSLVMSRHVVMHSDVVEYVDYLLILPNDKSPELFIAHAKVVVQVLDCLLTLAVDRWRGADLFHHSMEVPFLFE